MKISFLFFIQLLFASIFLHAQVSFTKLDIATGSSSANPRKFTAYNNQLYFTAFGSSASGIGEELYVTNGTTAGTQLVSNINPGFGASSTPQNLTVFNNELYFSAYTNTLGRELYKTNGTTVTLVKDIAVGADDGIENTAFIELNGFLYFFAREVAGLGYDLWRTDGTTNGTVKMVTVNSNSVAGNSLYFKKLNNELYFLAKEINDITVGTELYKYNPTSNTVSLVIDVFSGNGQTSTIGYAYFTEFDNKLFFVADNKLRYTNGTTTGIVTTGATNLTAYFKNKVLNNQLIFIGNSSNNGSQDIYKCFFDNVLNDYRIELVYNFAQTANLPFASSISDDGFDAFTALNNKLYFAAREASSPNSGVVFQIYETNGTTTNVAVPINYTGSPSARPLYFITAYQDKLYYQSSAANSPEQLWEANPSTGTYTQLTNYTPQANVPEQVFTRPMFVFNNELYFEAQKSGDGYELWKVNNSTLPSICNNFTGNINNNKALLQWQVSHQTNTKAFLIEKSEDGINYKKLAGIPAGGNVANTITYTYSDLLPSIGTYYYKLKQIDNDGTTVQLCSIIKLQNSSLVKPFMVYPNAANNYIIIKANNLLSNATLTIVSASGKQVYQQKIINTEQTINVRHLVNGSYFIIINNNGFLQTEKLIIQH